MTTVACTALQGPGVRQHALGPNILPDCGTRVIGTKGGPPADTTASRDDINVG